jgi:hypothetical protein
MITSVHLSRSPSGLPFITNGRYRNVSKQNKGQGAACRTRLPAQDRRR